MTLPGFLLARIAEDEEGARVFADHFALLKDGSGRPLASTEPLPPLLTYGRARAECEAKRRIVDWAAPITDSERVPTDRPGVYGRREVRYLSDDGWDVLAILALPYVDHADYSEAWRP